MTGRLQGSRGYFWKIIACPVPRPVGITDESERIHATAVERGRRAPPRDPYSRPRRRAWLESLPHARICHLTRFEQDHAFPGPGNGVSIQPVILPPHNLCVRVMRFLFGQN